MQRRRLALLAILGGGQARGRGVGRDKLVAYLWPEADCERGRPLLSDSVYRINQAVGEEAIIATGDELRLNPDVMWSDVAEFERAVESGDHERAAALYAGPLLDGVNLVDGTEFERWIDGERARLARAYEEVLDALAQGAESRGAAADAVTWWRRLAGHDPYSSRVALRFMQALAAIGDSAAAVRHAAVHTTLLREELGAEPNAGVVKLAERLRSEPVESSLVIDAKPEVVSEPQSVVVAPSPPVQYTPDEEETLALPSTTPEAKRRSINWIGVALAAVAFVAAGFFLWQRGRGPASAPVASIAVLPFTDLSPDGDNTYFSDGMTEELINTLTQVDGVHVAARSSVFAYKDRRTDVRDIGRSLGVATVLEGSVRKSGTKIRITVQFANAADGYQVWSESYDREMNDVFVIQEDISRAIVNVLRGRLVPPAVQIADRSRHDAEPRP